MVAPAAPAPKSPEEIEEMIRALLFARSAPCACKGIQHEFRCVMGGRFMDAAIDALLWSLGKCHPSGTDVNQTILDHYRAMGGT